MSAEHTKLPPHERLWHTAKEYMTHWLTAGVVVSPYPSRGSRLIIGSRIGFIQRIWIISSRPCPALTTGC